MATAPIPGAGRRAAAQRRGIRVSDGDRSLVLWLGNLGPRDDRLVRKESGFILTELIASDRFDSYSLCVLWWLTRVRNGERVTLDQVLDEYPTHGDLQRFTVDAFDDDEDVELSDEDSKTPEA
jgi:hypothetical protein